MLLINTHADLSSIARGLNFDLSFHPYPIFVYASIKPTIGEYQSVVRNIRREEVVLARLRLGHTRVTHSYLLQGEEHPQCVGCDAPFTVRHFLLECGDFAQVRNNCFHVNNMKELFQDIHIDSIMTFLRQINLFNKI